MVLSTHSAGLYKSCAVQKRRALISVYESVRMMLFAGGLISSVPKEGNYRDVGEAKSSVSGCR